MVAIIYHIAKMMKELDLDMPRHICLSGNGSKIIRLLDRDRRLEGAAELSKMIFEKVYEKKYHDGGLSIIHGANPKEATSKGGIMKNRHHHNTQNFDRLVLLGDQESTVIQSRGRSGSQSPIKYENLDQLYKDSILSSVKDFLDILFAINDDMSFEDYFGIGNLYPRPA